jgi:hypothetical protein
MPPNLPGEAACTIYAKPPADECPEPAVARPKSRRAEPSQVAARIHRYIYITAVNQAKMAAGHFDEARI